MYHYQPSPQLRKIVFCGQLGCVTKDQPKRPETAADKRMQTDYSNSKYRFSQGEVQHLITIHEILFFRSRQKSWSFM